jgi:hypothetical protein
MSEADLTVTSVEQDGRVLSGVGATTEQLETVMERHAPPEPEDKPEPTAQPAETPPEPTEKLTRGQKRFQALHAELDAVKAAKEVAEKERHELRAQLEAARRQPTPAAVAPTQTPPAPAHPEKTPSTRAKPTVDGIGTTYQTYEEFIEDLADWKSEQRLAALNVDQRIRQNLEADHQQRRVQDRFTAVRTEALKHYPDFDTVIQSGPGAVVNLSSDPALADARTQYVLNHPAAPHLMHTIAADATLANRLASLSDIDFGIELARLVPADPSSVSPPSLGVRAVSSAPPPYQAVGSGSKTTVLPSAELVKKAGFDFDKSGYRERRAAERGVNRR